MSTRALRRATSALVAVVAIAVSGCGGSSSKSSSADATFKRAFQQQLVLLHSVGGQVASAVGAAAQQSDVQLKRTFKQLAISTQPVIAGLGQLNPPPKYRADVTALRAALTQAYADLRAIAVAAGSHLPKAAALATNRLISDSAVVKAADTRISRALGLPGG